MNITNNGSETWALIINETDDEDYLNNIAPKIEVELKN